VIAVVCGGVDEASDKSWILDSGTANCLVCINALGYNFAQKKIVIEMTFLFNGSTPR